MPRKTPHKSSQVKSGRPSLEAMEFGLDPELVTTHFSSGGKIQCNW